MPLDAHRIARDVEHVFELGVDAGHDDDGYAALDDGGRRVRVRVGVGVGAGADVGVGLGLRLGLGLGLGSGLGLGLG